MGLAISSVDDFVFGQAPRPVRCGRGLEIGGGTVYPELNFTLPPVEINAANWPWIVNQYKEMIEGACKRAVDLEVPGVLIEFETLPPMTTNPAWALEITRILADALHTYHDKYGLKSALRLTPNDNRDHLRPPLMRRGEYWDRMVECFQGAAAAGADMLAIESTGGKEACDGSLTNADLRGVIFALGVLGARDMAFLWKNIVDVCRAGHIVASGDTACGFANTAMVLAEQRMIPRLFAAVVRVASVPRSLMAYEMGAVGPGKDCGYENVYLKAITGCPMSMEGRTSACAHLSRVGNIAQAVCDCWSNESVQNVRLLSANAPTVYLEQLAYDCRLMNVASQKPGGAATLRDWLVDSDSALDPQAYVLRPDVVIRIAFQIMQESTPYLQTRRAAFAALDEIGKAYTAGQVQLGAREVRWLDVLRKQVESLPDDENVLIKEFLASGDAKFLPKEYGLDV